MTRKGLRSMNSQSRLWVTAGRAAASLALMVGLSSLSGCNPHKDQLRPESLFGRIGRQGGQIIEPKKCMLRVAILNRPFRDRGDQRDRLEGRRRAGDRTRGTTGAGGQRPEDRPDHRRAPRRAAERSSTPRRRTRSSPRPSCSDDGEQTLISICDSVELVSLLLNRENHALRQGLPGRQRLLPRHRHARGQRRRRAAVHPRDPSRPDPAVLPAPDPCHALRPQQFRINDGQQEEALGDLAANLCLEPGQVVVIGCRPEQERSLGAFLFTASRDPRGPEAPEAGPGLGLAQPARGRWARSKRRPIAPSPPGTTKPAARTADKSARVASRGRSRG